MSNEPIRVDSVAEEYVYLAANPPASGAWQARQQLLSTSGDAMLDRLMAVSPAGDETEFVFDIGSFFGTIGRQRLGRPTTEWLDEVMARADAFARENGPHHPGSVARFPVPSRTNPGRIDVLMAVVARDERGRGLFAPPRVVTLDGETGNAIGVREFPGFDPNDWPPARLGDWPPADLARLDRAALAAMIARMSAIAVRLFDAWRDTAADYPQRRKEQEEYLELLGRLDLPGIVERYRLLNPAFWSWIETGDRTA